MPPKHRRKQAPHIPDEETSLDSELNFPHAPMHFHIDRPEEKGKELNGPMSDKRGLDGDRLNIAVLMFLYVLQGIPLGLAGSIPMILSSHKVSYKEQAVFSFVYWPFSVKLLWAPLVDSIYVSWFGRRKTWLVPIQYLIGIFMLVLSYNISHMLGEGQENFQIDVKALTAIFFLLNFLAATQDIAVDGWALTMLQRRNVGWASTCNTVGQTAGYFLGNVLFLALESPDFCNNYLRSVPQEKGLVTLPGFFYFWGLVFFLCTTLVMIFKTERTSSEDDTDEPEMGIVETYKTLVRIVRLPSIVSWCIVLLTSKLGFAAADAVTGLKLIEAGVPKERLALLAIPMIPIQILLPLYISRYTSGPRPLNVFIKAMPYRLVMSLSFAAIVWWTPSFKQEDGSYPFHYFLLLMVAYASHQFTLYSMFVAQMAFHAKVSDPAIGGTYMTLLNTVANLGGNWPSTMALWFVDGLTSKSCQGGVGDCSTSQAAEMCTKEGGTCITTIDGYYIESAICTVLGVLWLLWRRNKVKQLDSLPENAWKCN